MRHKSQLYSGGFCRWSRRHLSFWGGREEGRRSLKERAKNERAANEGATDARTTEERIISGVMASEGHRGPSVLPSLVWRSVLTTKNRRHCFRQQAGAQYARAATILAPPPPSFSRLFHNARAKLTTASSLARSRRMGSDEHFPRRSE